MSKNLAEIIKANPGCVAIVDNDCWTLYISDPNEGPDDQDPDDLELASDSDTFDPPLGDGGYGSGSNYGGDLLQALAQIVGMRVGSV
jgi:hypothetical protein